MTFENQKLLQLFIREYPDYSIYWVNRMNNTYHRIIDVVENYISPDDPDQIPEPELCAIFSNGKYIALYGIEDESFSDFVNIVPLEQSYMLAHYKIDFEKRKNH